MNAKLMLLFVLCIDVVFLLRRYAMVDDGGGGFYGYDGRIESQADSGAGTYVVAQANASDLPSSTEAVDPEATTGFFTDIFRSTKNWLLEFTGAYEVWDTINAVPNFLNSIGLPTLVSFTLGGLWHIFGIFTLISFLWCKE